MIDSIDWNVENVESCGNCVEHVDAPEDVGSFDYDLSIDLERGPLLILAITSHTEPSPPDSAVTSERRMACPPGPCLRT